MIKANELRIGNMVYYRGNHYSVRAVDSIGANRKYECIIQGVSLPDLQYVSYGQLERIPLTPEIFKKCVFADGFPIVTCCGTIKGVPVGSDSYMMQIDDEHIRPVYYLHELQNIHHALMEKELEVIL